MSILAEAEKHVKIKPFHARKKWCGCKTTEALMLSFKANFSLQNEQIRPALWGNPSTNSTLRPQKFEIKSISDYVITGRDRPPPQILHYI